MGQNITECYETIKFGPFSSNEVTERKGGGGPLIGISIIVYFEY